MLHTPMNRTLSVESIYAFLYKMRNEFTMPLEKQVGDIWTFSKKLYDIATIAYHTDTYQIVSAVIGYTDNTPDNTSYITLVVTTKDHRGRGLTQKLLTEYENLCIGKGLSGMWLTTAQSNQTAHKAYSKAGFTQSYINEKGYIVFEKAFCHVE